MKFGIGELKQSTIMWLAFELETGYNGSSAKLRDDDDQVLNELGKER